MTSTVAVMSVMTTAMFSRTVSVIRRPEVPLGPGTPWSGTVATEWEAGSKLLRECRCRWVLVIHTAARGLVRVERLDKVPKGR